MLPIYRVIFLHAPPWGVRFGRDIWRFTYGYHGKNGKNATLEAVCNDGRRIVVLDGRERAVLHALSSVETQPGTVLHELWVRLSKIGAVELKQRRFFKFNGVVYEDDPTGLE